MSLVGDPRVLNPATSRASRTSPGRGAATDQVGRLLPSLTGLRWLAALLVFCYHVRNCGFFGGSSGSAMDVLFGAGATGVSFFFLLSGFVLA
jgi:peptidoglycan/LPS O-acetylase OafA/YrhL